MRGDGAAVSIGDLQIRFSVGRRPRICQSCGIGSPGVLAHVLNKIRAANIEEMEHLVFAGAEAAIARIALDGPLDDATLTLIHVGNEDIPALSLLRL